MKRMEKLAIEAGRETSCSECGYEGFIAGFTMARAMAARKISFRPYATITRFHDPNKQDRIHWDFDALVLMERDIKTMGEEEE